MAVHCLLHNNQLPLSSGQGPLKSSLLSHYHTTHDLCSIKLHFLSFFNYLPFVHVTHLLLSICSPAFPVYSSLSLRPNLRLQQGQPTIIFFFRLFRLLLSSDSYISFFRLFLSSDSYFFLQTLTKFISIA